MAHERRRESRMTTIWTTMLATAVVGIATMTGDARSDSLLIDNIDHASTDSHKMPARGMSMNKVESVYGSPSVRHQAVGDPPISRWEYSNFVVYFEYSHVIHSVPKRQQARAN